MADESKAEAAPAAPAESPPRDPSPEPSEKKRRKPRPKGARQLLLALEKCEEELELMTQRAKAEAAVVKAKDGVIQGMWEEIEKAERKGEATAALVEKVIMAKVVQSSNRAEALERRLKNARFVSEASERLAAEAVVERLAAGKEAAENARHMRRLSRHVDAMRKRETRETLGEVHAVRLAAINAAETAVRDFESDPELTLPIGTTKRRNLQKTRAKLRALVHDRDSANDMAERLDGVARLDDATRTAAARGDGETVRLLASRGGKVDEPDAFGATALDYACGRGSKEAVRACLDAGADALGDALGLGEIFVTKKNARTLVKETPPEKILNPYLASAAASAKVALDRSGQSLSQAALSHSASAKSGELRGYTEAEALACSASRPLVLASARGHVDVVQVLLDHVGEGPPLERLLAATDSRHRTPLHTACANSRAHIAKLLVHAGAVLDAVDASGATPLHLVAACETGSDDDVVEIAKLLTARGANQTLRNSASERPVDTAHQRGRRSVIIALNDAWDEFKAAEHPPIVVPSPPPSP